MSRKHLLTEQVKRKISRGHQYTRFIQPKTDAALRKMHDALQSAIQAIDAYTLGMIKLQSKPLFTSSLDREGRSNSRKRGTDTRIVSREIPHHHSEATPKTCRSVNRFKRFGHM